jgi:shikimate kinase
MSKILLSGVPGSGKSTVAAYMEKNFEFFHIDMEQDDFAPRHEFAQNREAFLNKIATHENVIISWGFGPFQDREAIEYLQKAGYTLLWLDGDRTASFREFMKRENNDPVKESLYYGQMQMIVVTRIVETLKPHIVNPFSGNGTFRPVQHIAGDVIKAAVA